MSRMAHSLAASATRDLGAIARQTRRNAILYVVVGVLMTMAVVSGLIAGGLYLAATMGGIYAALFIALVTLILALILLAVLMVLNRIERRRQRAARAGRALAASAALTTLGTVARSKNPLVLAAIGGLVFALTRTTSRSRD
ncbi:hypothetical protein [Mariluticola halotolerans]|uniref:hypothetical protein n=1 Tax=Mariluticola halotolerans TaxID=2909283 RepID=UPI0026E1B39C|nr:hypothetical protein [Mariluticola halotolerans]UJQ95112.1 hypothetical protein L1P08_03760 [Mariluticola halotolerans]